MALTTAASTMRAIFGNCAMQDADDMAKIVRQKHQNLPNMRCLVGLCGGKIYQYKQ